MCNFRNLAIGMTAWLVVGCASEQTVTPEQIALQNKVDTIVAQALFARNMDQQVSYNIHTDGFVVIKLDESVSFPAYNDLIAWLRARPEIPGVRATQMGTEVCPRVLR